MEYDHILVRYGEISLKGKNRKHFINQLKSNLKQKLAEFPNVHIIRGRDRMLIKLNGEDYEKVIERSKEVFGIQSLNVALRVENDLEKIKEGALFA